MKLPTKEPRRTTLTEEEKETYGENAIVPTYDNCKECKHFQRRKGNNLRYHYCLRNGDSIYKLTICTHRKLKSKKLDNFFGS